MIERPWMPWPNSSSVNRKSKIQNRKLVGIVALAVGFAISGAVALAQQPKKIPRIGYVQGTDDPSIPGRFVNALREGLRDLGYLGKNILIEHRSTEGKSDHYPAVVTELLQLKVDVIVSPTPRAIRAAMQATKTIPIVMATPVDPVASGLADSLSRLGGNVTGITRLTQELSGKRLELLKEMVPRISLVGILCTEATAGLNHYEAAAHALKMQLKLLEVRGPNPDIDGALQAATNRRASALITIRHPVINRQQKQIAELAIRNRLPSMYEGSDYVEAGGLASYAANDAENFRRAARYVDKI